MDPFCLGGASPGKVASFGGVGVVRDEQIRDVSV